MRWKETIDALDFGPQWSGDLNTCSPGVFESAHDVGLEVALFRWLAGLSDPVNASASVDAQACALEVAVACGGQFAIPLTSMTHAVLAPRAWFADPSSAFRLLSAGTLSFEIGSTATTSCALGLGFDLPAAVSWPPSGAVPVEALPPVWALWRQDPWPSEDDVKLTVDGVEVDVDPVLVGPFPLLPGAYVAEVPVPDLGPGLYVLEVADLTVEVQALGCAPALWPT